jgi:adenosylhomocysteinase
MGANVTITEVDPTKALEAAMDGFRVMPMAKACPIGDIFVTLTGDTSILRRDHFQKMKDGAIVCNSGHFNVEIDIPALKSLSRTVRMARDFVQEFTLKNGKKIFLLAEGRLVNLSAAEGHPASVMDMSFANQALSAEYLAENRNSTGSVNLENKVYPVPKEIDREIARLKLYSMGIAIDRLTPEQEKYLASWQEGT